MRDGGRTIAFRQQRFPQRLNDPHFRSLLCLVDVGDGAAVGGVSVSPDNSSRSSVEWNECIAT